MVSAADLASCAILFVCVDTPPTQSGDADLSRVWSVIDALPEASERVPGLRMIVVAGPRVDPRSLPAHEGLEIHAYVHDLYRHLAVCDLAKRCLDGDLEE